MAMALQRTASVYNRPIDVVRTELARVATFRLGRASQEGLSDQQVANLEEQLELSLIHI